MKKRKMNLKGKCKKCIGCGKLAEKSFGGVKKCKYYVKADSKFDWAVAIFWVIDWIIIIGTLLIIYRKLMLNVGG